MEKLVVLGVIEVVLEVLEMDDDGDEKVSAGVAPSFSLSECFLINELNDGIDLLLLMDFVFPPSPFVITFEGSDPDVSGNALIPYADSPSA